MVQLENKVVDYAQTMRMHMARDKITQQVLADKLGVSRKYVNQVMNEKRKPSLSSLERMAELFDVPLSTFILWGE